MYRNICLIGLPHSGKTTLGKQLYKYLHKGFIDTDDIIRNKYKKDLSEIIYNRGRVKYLEIEQDVISSLQVSNTVISTGGSVIYNPETMVHLKNTLNSEIYHLFLSRKEFLLKAENLEQRGVIMKPKQSICDLYNERLPLYDKYADKTLSACRSINLDIFRGETYIPTKNKSTYHDLYSNNVWFVPIDQKNKRVTYDKDNYFWSRESPILEPTSTPF